MKFKIMKRCPDCRGFGWKNVYSQHGNTESITTKGCEKCKGSGFIELEDKDLIIVPISD